MNEIDMLPIFSALVTASLIIYAFTLDDKDY